MTLQFNPGAYEQAFQIGQENRAANRLRPLQEIQQLSDTTSSIADTIEKAKQRKLLNTPLNQLLMSHNATSDPVAQMSEPVISNAPQSPTPQWGQESDANPNLPSMNPSFTDNSVQPPGSMTTPQGSTIERFRNFLNGNTQAWKAPTVTPQAPDPNDPLASFRSPTGLGALTLSQLGPLAAVKTLFPKPEQEEYASAGVDTNNQPILFGKRSGTIKVGNVPGGVKPKQEGQGQLFTPDQAKVIAGLDDATVGQLKQLYPGGIPKDALSMYGTNTDRDEKEQNKLEDEYRKLRTRALQRGSGGLGLQDQKVNAAIHSRQLIDGSTDPKTGEIHINQVTSPELAMSLASLVSGGNAPALETIKEMTPQALEGYIKSHIGYIFGKPVDVLPQDWAQNLKHMIDRQGLTSEALRDSYYDQLNAQAPTKLSRDRAQRVESENLGASYSKTFGLAPIVLNKGVQPATQTNGEAVRDVSSEQEALALPPGTKFRLPNGRTGTVQ